MTIFSGCDTFNTRCLLLLLPGPNEVVLVRHNFRYQSTAMCSFLIFVTRSILCSNIKNYPTESQATVIVWINLLTFRSKSRYPLNFTYNYVNYYKSQFEQKRYNYYQFKFFIGSTDDKKYPQSDNEHEMKWNILVILRSVRVQFASNLHSIQSLHWSMAHYFVIVPALIDDRKKATLHAYSHKSLIMP